MSDCLYKKIFGKNSNNPYFKGKRKSVSIKVYCQPKNTPLNLKQIHKAGKILRPINVTLTDKKTISEGKRCKLILTQGSDSIVAFCSKQVGDKMNEHLSYSIQGVIFASKQEGSFVQTGQSKYKLNFDSVQISPISATTPRSNAAPKTEAARKTSRPCNAERITSNNAIINEGSLRMYLGCNDCTTKISYSEKRKGFFCSKKGCIQSKKSQDPKICLLIKDLAFTEATGNVIRNATMFDKAAQTLLGKVGNSFVEDSSAREKFRKFLNSKVDIDVKQDPKGDGYIVERIKVNEVAQNSSVNEDDQDVPVAVSDTGAPRDTETAYIIKSVPKGLVLLINNETFQEREDSDKRRAGCEHDERIIKELFTFLGFEIYKGGLKDVASKDLHGIIFDYQNEFKQRNYDSSIVCILSHGNSFEIEMADGPCKNMYNDVVYRFSERRFSEFSSKPKIFIFDTCQEFKLSSNSSELDMPRDFYSDILVCLPALPGYPSYRPDHESSSVFIKHLVEVFRADFKGKHIEDMLKKVQRKMYDFSQNNIIQQQSISYGILFKDFYFA